MTVSHVLSLDVEDYFQVLNLRASCPKDRWDEFELRCEEPTRRFLDLLDRYDAKATFFCLGWIAERLPDLIREVAARGHEVASHGYDHECLPDLGEQGFRADLARTSEILEPLTGEQPSSFRACTWSITEKTPWALPALVDAGFTCDSSIHPIAHPDYGVADAPLHGHMLEPRPGKPLFELPPLVVRRFGRRLPLGGGGYLRLFPVRWIHRALRNRERAGEPSCIYLHPWELDPEQPRLGSRGIKSFRHYVGLRGTERKLCFLLERHRFTTLRNVAARFRQQQLSAAAGASGAPSRAEAPSEAHARTMPEPPPAGPASRRDARD